MLDPSQAQQRIVGFGGAFTEATAVALAAAPPLQQQQVLEAYFGEEGLQYSLCRVHMGSCDYCEASYSEDDTPDASAQPPEGATVSGAVVSAEPVTPSPEPTESEHTPPEEEEDAAVESPEEPTTTPSGTATADTSVTPSDTPPPGPLPTVSVNPAWPPKSATTASSEPPSQFLKPGPLGPDMDP